MNKRLGYKNSARVFVLKIILVSIVIPATFVVTVLAANYIICR